MPNQSKINTATFEHDGNSIRLRASLKNLNSLEEAAGTSDILFYMQTKVRNTTELARFFYHLQVVDEGAERSSMDDIYEWFFADLGDIMDEAWQKKLADCIAMLFGSKLQAKLAELSEAEAKKKKEPGTKKKPPVSA